ncbi:phage head spike fiber domain-containing protein [Endozoicomonas sp. 2B-B]
MSTQELVESVDNLTKNTTEILNVVKERKQVLEDSATSAEQSARSAAADASEAKQNRDQSYNYSQQALDQANRAKQIAELDRVEDALRLAAIPAPDFHLPLISDLRIQEGFGPADQIDVSAAQDGSKMVDMPTKSAKLTRSSSATYINKSGVLVSADVNEPRVQKEGIFLEGSSTNILLNSEDRVEPNSDGTREVYYSDISSTIKTTKMKAGTGSNYAWFRGTARITNGNKITVSAWVRPLVEITRIRCQINEMDIQSHNFDKDDWGEPVNGFYRIWASGTANADKTVTPFCWPSVTNALNSGEAYMEIAGAQVEEQSHLSSYIPTGETPVTRSGDLLENIDANNFTDKGMTVSFSCSTDSDIDGLRIFEFYYGSSTRTLFADWKANKSVNFGLSGVSSKITRTNSELINSRNKKVNVCLQFLPNAVKGYINGGVPVELSDATPLPRSTKMIIGSNNQGFFSINGHIRDFRIWHKSLTDEQVSALGRVF